MTQSPYTRLSEAAQAFKLEELERRLEFDDVPPDGGGDPSTDGVDVVLWSWKFW